MICDVNFISGYGKECPGPEGCVWWDRYCKERLKDE
jgi:hypothetical protein